MAYLWMAVIFAAVNMQGNHEVNSFTIDFQALDATRSLLKYEQPIPGDSKDSESSETGEITLGDVLLSPLFPMRSSNMSEPCFDVMKHLAIQGGDFTHCLVEHARPFRVCEKCVGHYTRFTHLYEKLLTDPDCSTMLLMADRVHVITAIYDVFTQTWGDADCAQCFDTVDVNATSGKVSFNYSTDFLLLREMQANVSHCFNISDKDHKQGTSSPVCEDCKSEYRSMNKKYNQMMVDHGSDVCMDLVDMMNYTRLMWSSHFNCSRPRPDATGVIIISVVIALATVALYTTSKFITKTRMPTIFKAKRMASTRGGHYGSMRQGEVDTSLPRMPLYPERRRSSAVMSTDDNSIPKADADGNGHPGTSSKETS